MKRSILFTIAVLVVASGALAFRLPELDLKPFHGDEAVQAYKFGRLLEDGYYKYNPREYHGPTLYYLTLPSAWLTSDGTFAGTSDFTYRIVPVVFGAGLVMLLLMVGDGIGRLSAVCAGVLVAVSPAMVYFSRYYIQEMSLVFFTFLVIAAGWRYVKSRRIGWMLPAGAGLGLMHATKETCILALASMGVALIVTVIRERRRSENPAPLRLWLRPWHIAAGLGVAAVISVSFFSSFFTNAQGPLDSIKTYAINFQRAGGVGMHDHPWYTYLKDLAFFQTRSGGPWWSEGLILGLAAVGFVAALLRRGIPRGTAPLAGFMAVYTLLLTAAYSAIPYKTPWCMLSFLHGMILLAGIGATVLLRVVPKWPLKGALALLLIAATWHLGAQAESTIDRRFCASSYNPYVYSHSVNGVVRMADRIEELAELHALDHDTPMIVQVIAPAPDDPSLHDSWPLPYYLRRLDAVGYGNSLPERLDVPVIVAAPTVRAELDDRLRNIYDLSEVRDNFTISYYGLRPGVNLLLYVRKDLWDVFIRKQEQPPEAPQTSR